MWKHYSIFLIPLILLRAGLLTVRPAQAPPTSTEKACHICEEMGIVDVMTATPSLQVATTITTQPDGKVCGVLFWMDGCPYCHVVLESVLPPLQKQYGDRLDIRLIEVVTMQDMDGLYEVASAHGIPRDDVGVPFFIIGEHVLIGSQQIPEELPGLIEQYMAAGGVDYPDLPVLADFLTIATPTGAEKPSSTPESMKTPALPIVHLLLFWTPDCHACQIVVSQTLPPIKEKYGDQFDVQYVDVITSEDVEKLYQVAAAFGTPKEQVNLPMLIIGDHVLIGSEQIPAELIGMIEMYLAAGGVDLPDIARMEEGTSSPSPVSSDRPDGFGLAIAILVAMIAALVYAVFVLFRAYTGAGILPQPRWLGYAIPILCLVGLGVAGYLTYVETQPVSAVCGPVGDCNTVQSSQFAWLFGVMPVGVLGLLGYLGILVAWLWSRSREERLVKIAPLAIFGMTLFGVLFSIYLTYLEPFVIRAVCLWCLSSSIIITLLFLLGLNALTQAVNIKDD